MEKDPSKLRNGTTVAFCVLGILRPSADGLGLGLGHPRVTPGSPKRHPWVTHGSRLGRPEQVLCLQQKMKKAGVGAEIDVIRKAEPFRRMNTDGANQNESGCNFGMSAAIANQQSYLPGKRKEGY